MDCSHWSNFGDRLGHVFFRSWPPQKHELEPELNFADVRSVMDTSNADYLMASTALRTIKRGVGKAIMIATDEYKAAEAM